MLCWCLRVVDVCACMRVVHVFVCVCVSVVGVCKNLLVKVLPFDRIPFQRIHITV